MSIAYTRREVVAALTEFRDAGMSAKALADYLEGFISAKVDEILHARADNARAGLGKRDE